MIGFSPVWWHRCLCGIAAVLFACAGDDSPPAQAGLQELLAHAQRRIDDGDYAAATASFRRALLADSTSTLATIGLAHVYEQQGRHELAQRYQRRAFHQDFRRGTQARKAGDLVAARIAFTAALATMPSHPMAPLQIGEIWFESGNTDSAIAYFGRAVQANPGFADAHIKLGKALLKAGDPDAAQGAFEAAIETNINAVDAYVLLGTIFAERGEWALAASRFETALLIRPAAEVALRGLREARAHL